MDGVELIWLGKRREPPPIKPRQLFVRERYGTGPSNRLVQGDHLVVLASLVPELRGAVDLITIDPPFATGRDFQAYDDRLPPSLYLQNLRDGFLLSHLLLRETGSICVHLDYRAAPHAKFLLDEVFGADHFYNEIIWAYGSGGRTQRAFPAKHDTILVYRRGKGTYFNSEGVGMERRNARRNHMKRQIDEQGRAYRSIRSAGKEYRYYEDEHVLPTDVWVDISHLHQKDPERTGYPTQKPERLLERIILAFSPPNGLVLDYCCGSGTAAVAAEKLGRPWMSVDISPQAIETTCSRLLNLPERRPFAVETLVE